MGRIDKTLHLLRNDHWIGLESLAQGEANGLFVSLLIVSEFSADNAFIPCCLIDSPYSLPRAILPPHRQ